MNYGGPSVMGGYGAQSQYGPYNSVQQQQPQTQPPPSLSGQQSILYTTSPTGQQEHHWIHNYIEQQAVPQISPQQIGMGSTALHQQQQLLLQQQRQQEAEEKRILQNWFEAVNQDKSGKITAEQLGSALSAGGETFNSQTVQNMIQMFDRNSQGTIDFLEFTYLFAYIKAMRQSFESYTGMKPNGLLDKTGVDRALTDARYRFANNRSLLILCSKFDKKNKGMISFENFLEIGVYLGTMRTWFQKNGWRAEGPDGVLSPEFENAIIQELSKYK